MNATERARSLGAWLRQAELLSRSRSRKRRIPIFPAEALEDRTLLAFDFGDAPDTGAGTSAGNYNTLAADGGPSHTIIAGLFLGASVDDEVDGLPGANANGDDIGGALPDDEDGLNHPVSDLDLTIGAFPTVSVIVTNNTGSGATLYGWIDANADGVFDNATERASIAVPNGTSGEIVTLTFPTIPVGFTGTTYARFRLSTDAASANPTGAASDGEVEDYRATIVEGSNGAVSSEAKIASGIGNFGMLSSNGRFGEAVASLGDLDGDGVTDLAVGAIADNTAGFAQGAVHILFMNSNGTVKSSTIIASNTGGMGQVQGFLPNFGSSLTALGDLDGDGVTDMAVGATGDDAGSGDNNGAVYVLFLNPDGTVKAHQRLASGVGGMTSLSGAAFFGSSVTNLGDLDGDGVTDMAVGSQLDDTGATDTGAVYILFMNLDGTAKEVQKIAEGVGGMSGLSILAYFGSSVASLGDLNGDGITELAVGSDRDGTGGSERGAVYVLFLNSDGTIQSRQKIADSTGGFGTLTNADWFGRSLSAVGDLDGNGVTDLAVGAWFDDTGGSAKGATYIVYLNADGTVKSSRKIASNTGGLGTINGSFFGSSVTNLGDLDGDGRPDLAIGASNGDASNAGAVYITYLDAGAPTVARIARQAPGGSPTNNDQVTFRVFFSENVINVDVTDFLLNGTAAVDGTISTALATTDPAAWDVTVTGLATSNGTINLDFAPGQDIEDLFANPLANTTPDVEEQYVIDNIVPVVSTLSPADGFLFAASFTNLVITFDEDVQKGAGNIVIKRSGNDSTFQTINVADAAVTVSEAMVTIDPPMDFEDTTEYYVQIDAGAFEDLAGNPYAGINDSTAWNFTAIVQTLTLSFMDSAITEAGGPAATTARVTRNGDPAAALVVTITNPDDTELFLPTTWTIPAGASFFDFGIETVNDGDLDGDQLGLVVTASATDYVGDNDSIDVLDDDTALDRTLGGHLFGTVAADTYRVLFDMTVDAGRTLLVEPASTLLFAAGTGITVNGTLTADGDAGSEIVFTSVSGTPAPGDWDGISLPAISQPRSILDHIEVAYGVRGINLPSVNDPHVTLSNSDIHHNSLDGVRSEARHRDFIQLDDFLLERNQIHDNGRVGLSIVAIGSSNSTGTGSQNSMIVIGNEIFNNVGFGVEVVASYAAAGGFVATVAAFPTIEGNHIHDNGGGIKQSAFESPGAFGTGSVSATIRNNLIVDNTGNAIELRRSGSGSSRVTPRLFNNTIANNGGAGIFHDADIIPFSSQGILNNIVTGNGTGIGSNAAFVPTAGAVGFNDVFGNGGSNWVNYPVAFGNLTGINPTGLPADAENNISVDPLFVSATDFHLQSNSPVIDAGNTANGSIPTTDFDGDARMNADIGFDEVVFVTAAVTAHALNGSGNPNRSGLQTLMLSFDRPVTVAGVTSLRLFNHTTSTAVDISAAVLSGNGTNTLMWDLTGLALADGRYSAELPADQVTTAGGGQLVDTHTIEFHVLRGDVSGDGRVNATDFIVVDANFDPLPGTPFRTGDANGDGRVNATDFIVVDANFNPLLLAPLTYDFGDAPETGTSFPTTLANDGARHVITGNTLFLGADRDAEADGQPDATANGDGADENGIVVGNLEVGTNVAVTVTSNGAGFLNGWVDFNQDGDWDDPGEQVFTDTAVVGGPNNLQIAVPSGATLGSTFARFRLTATAGYSYLGLAPDGEVEDYQLTVADPPLDSADSLTQETLTPSVHSTLPPWWTGRLISAPLHSLITFTARPFFTHPLSLFSDGLPSRARGR